MNEQEIKELVKAMSREEKKNIVVPFVITLGLSLLTALYTAGILRAEVSSNTKRHDERTAAAAAVPVIQNDISNIKDDIELGRTAIGDLNEKMDDLQTGQNDLSTQVQILIDRDQTNGHGAHTN